MEGLAVALQQLREERTHAQEQVGRTPEENQAIVDALHGLDILWKEVAAWLGRAG